MAFSDRLRTAEDILALFEEFSVEGSTGRLSDVGTAIGGGIYQWVDDSTPKGEVKHNIVQDDERITFLELRKSTTRADADAQKSALCQQMDTELSGTWTNEALKEFNRQSRIIDNNSALTQTIRGKSTLKSIFHDAPHPDAVPCYFLPWNPTGGAVELKIPAGGGGPATDNNPILFLTAALSGCSIYVEGPATSPTIWHCGTQFTTPGKSAEAFWNSVMSELGHDPGQLGAAHTQDYTVPKRAEDYALKVAVDRQNFAKKSFQERFSETLDVEDVQTWGAVFGIRKDQLWTFYMQENCTVTYHKIRKTKWLGRRVPAGPSRVCSRPMYCREIFPTGGGTAACFQRLRRLSVG